MERIEGVLDGVDYHQLYLVADDDLDGFPEGSFEDEIDPHTLAVPMDHSVCVITGIAMGQVNLTIEVLDEAPRPGSRDRWRRPSTPLNLLMLPRSGHVLPASEAS